ncbi:hypothetical protein BYT27DRAFT_7204452 [Phlegmacium glaucopus]|nr:hypothetical protein BYT27DRAFT_7204452 [Phlegmacium glaucopus]
MADCDRASTKHQRGNYLDSSSGQSRKTERISGLFISSADSHFDDHKFENRPDREHDAYNSHGSSLRTSREERTPHQGYPQADRITDRGRHIQSADRIYHRYDKSEDRRSGSNIKHRRRTPHDHPETINSHSHERFDGVDDGFHRREISNGHRTTNPSAANEHRGQGVTVEKPHERYDRKNEADSRQLVREKRRHWDNEHLQKNYNNYKHREQEEQEHQESRSPVTREMSTSVPYVF